MLLSRIAEYLDTVESGFSYIRDDPRMEIWVKGKEWYPILVSEIYGRGYLISWGEIEYTIEDGAKAYAYLLRLITNIKEINHD
ncbi:hypothetical protein ACFOET_05590 [Parapedobacter deserti]|uniref:Uncharacterized protein n=1 Tax=Parapedobacter deserti TaxID=1912957 RepID=A0ABV7JJ08_9SPHI